MRYFITTFIEGKPTTEMRDTLDDAHAYARVARTVIAESTSAGSAPVIEITAEDKVRIARWEWRDGAYGGPSGWALA